MARLASTLSPAGTTDPVPLMAVETASLPSAALAGIFTTGALPNAPDTLTDEFGSELEPEEEPQPTRARPATSGTRSAAEMRRMRNPRCVEIKEPRSKRGAQSKSAHSLPAESGPS